MRSATSKNIHSSLYFLGVLLVVFGILQPSAPPAKPDAAPGTVTAQATGTAPATATSDAPANSTPPRPFSMSDALATMGCVEVGCPAAVSDASSGPIHDPIGEWVTQYRVLVIGLIMLLVASLWSYSNYADQRDKDRATKHVLPDEVEINGVKHKLPTLKSKATLILPGDPRFAGLSFDKIVGQKEAKIEIEEILDFLQHPENYAELEADLPRGVLLFGAHGTGKTMLVRTLAALCGFPVLEMAGSEYVEKFVGVGASRMRDVYDDADALVLIFGACLVFIDEIDAVAKTRGGQNSNDERESTLNQLLVEMDGTVPRPRVVTFGATNRRDTMDPAALRPGRFDRQIEFFNPNRDERAQMIGIYLPERLRDNDIDLAHAALATPSASGAHLKNIANEAKLMTARAKLKRVPQHILDEAVQKVMFGARRDSQRSVLHADELDTIKKHEAGHALLYWLRTKKAPLRFTIIPRGQTGGHVEYSEDFEMLKTKEHFLTRLIVMMGGYAATLLLRNEQEDTGIGSDYENATQLAMQMCGVYGMSSLGKVNFDALNKAGLLSDAMKHDFVTAVKKLVDGAAETAVKMLEENLEDLNKLVDAVGEKETLLAADFEEVFIKPKQAAEVVVPFKRPDVRYHKPEESGQQRAAFGIPGFLRGLRRRRHGEKRRQATAE
jgi:cell division protease FtsH